MAARGSNTPHRGNRASYDLLTCCGPTNSPLATMLAVIADLCTHTKPVGYHMRRTPRWTYLVDSKNDFVAHRFDYSILNPLPTGLGHAIVGCDLTQIMAEGSGCRWGVAGIPSLDSWSGHIACCIIMAYLSWPCTICRVAGASLSSSANSYMSRLVFCGLSTITHNACSQQKHTINAPSNDNIQYMLPVAPKMPSRSLSGH